MSNYATPCEGCLCNTCINSFANENVKTEEVEEYCFRCEEKCRYYDRNNSEVRIVSTCGRYRIDNYHAEKLRKKWKIL